MGVCGRLYAPAASHPVPIREEVW